MTARGYMIGPNGALICRIIANQPYADVSCGSVRYNIIATKADIAIIATAANGSKMTKNYRANYLLKGRSVPLTRIGCRRGKQRSDRYHC